MTSIACSFCGKAVDAVTHMIAGPSAHICDVCISFCVDAIDAGTVEETAGEEIAVRLAGQASVPCTRVSDWTPFVHRGQLLEWCSARGSPDVGSVIAVRRRGADVPAVGEALVGDEAPTEDLARAVAEHYVIIMSEPDFPPGLLERLGGLATQDFDALGAAVAAERRRRGSGGAPPCTCNYLALAADESGNPIAFDAAMNEYHIAYEASGMRARKTIYYCPFCGGAAPKSKRAERFATITYEESKRLRDLFATVKTIDDAISRFGPPDHDDPRGLVVSTPGSETGPPREDAYRVVTYARLSDQAEVELVDGERGVRVVLRGKFLG